MSYKVKILDFARKDTPLEDAQSRLEVYLNEGYSIKGVCESGSVVSYTLVKNTEVEDLIASRDAFHSQLIPYRSTEITPTGMPH